MSCLWAGPIISRESSSFGSPQVVQFEMTISIIANWMSGFPSIQTRLFIVEKLDYEGERAVDK